MRLSAEKLKSLCRKQGLTVTELLHQAGVSRTAYYALCRKGDILPRSIRNIAARLHVSPSVFLNDDKQDGKKMRRILRQVDKIRKRKPDADPDNIRHTLLLLEEEPIERLKRSLTRARKFNFH